MKIAVFYSGLIRSYRHVYDSINKILPNECVDFYFHTWEGQGEDFDFVLNSRDWKDFIVEKNIEKVSSSTAKGFYSKMKSFSLVKDANFVVYSRFDNYYWPESQEIKFNILDPNKFYILPYCNWKGIEDRFCVGTLHSIQEWVNVFELHQKGIVDFNKVPWGEGEKLTAQNITRHQWEHLDYIKTSIVQGVKGKDQDILKSERCTPQFNGKENFRALNDSYEKYLKLSTQKK